MSHAGTLPATAVGATSDAKSELAMVWPLALLYALNISGFQFVALLPTMIGMPGAGFSLVLRVFIVGVSMVCVVGWLAHARPVYRGAAGGRGR